MSGEPCRHRWRIDSPGGEPFVMGRCRDCGAERLFAASFDAAMGERDVRDANDGVSASKGPRR